MGYTKVSDNEYEDIVSQIKSIFPNVKFNSNPESYSQMVDKMNEFTGNRKLTKTTLRKFFYTDMNDSGNRSYNSDTVDGIKKFLNSKNAIGGILHLKKFSLGTLTDSLTITPVDFLPDSDFRHLLSSEPVKLYIGSISDESSAAKHLTRIFGDDGISTLWFSFKTISFYFQVATEFIELYKLTDEQLDTVTSELSRVLKINSGSLKNRLKMYGQATLIQQKKSAPANELTSLFVDSVSSDKKRESTTRKEKESNIEIKKLTELQSSAVKEELFLCNISFDQYFETTDFDEMVKYFYDFAKNKKDSIIYRCFTIPCTLGDNGKFTPKMDKQSIRQLLIFHFLNKLLFTHFSSKNSHSFIFLYDRDNKDINHQLRYSFQQDYVLQMNNFEEFKKDDGFKPTRKDLKACKLYVSLPEDSLGLNQMAVIKNDMFLARLFHYDFATRLGWFLHPNPEFFKLLETDESSLLKDYSNESELDAIVDLGFTIEELRGIKDFAEKIYKKLNG